MPFSLLKGFWPAGQTGTMRNVDRTHNAYVAITEIIQHLSASLPYSALHRRVDVPVAQR